MLVLLGIAVVFVAGMLLIRTNCKASDPSCVPEVTTTYFGGSPTDTFSVCGCNASLVIRNETNARVLSNTEFGTGDSTLEDPRRLSAFAVFFTEFIFNDIFNPSYVEPVLKYSIPVPAGDPVFAFFSSSNITFRIPGSPFVSPSCPYPINNGTSFIDLSNVYGVNPTQMLNMRTLSRGRMRMVHNDESLLLERNATTHKWTIADHRDTYNAGVLSLHTLAVRNHNYWADVLLAFHHGWTDEQLFWKARQLNIAEWQRIVYHEWLPVLLFASGLTPDPLSPVPNTLTESRVTLEMAISLMPAMIDTMIPSTIGDRRILPYAYFTGRAGQDLVSAENIELFLGDSVRTFARRYDRNIIPERRNGFAWWSNSTAEPQDWVAIHIQRARALRTLDWHSIYQCINGVPFAADPRDAYQGLLEEDIFPGTSFGPTTVHMLNDLFHRIREADQAYYTYNAAAIGPVYWDAVNQATMGKLLVRNGRGPYGVFNDNKRIQHPFAVPTKH